MSTDVDFTILNYRILKEKVEEYLSQLFDKPIQLQLAPGDHFCAQIPRQLTEDEMKHIKTKLRSKRPR
ncbi:hypothetical protein MAPG_09373 [Magnaporthiopsis poae ATCC 64411]|uniref:Uncharacterized protein n=1 Tax=Magnaporthiopsis poae (strain ATCC 64411 / 73-15) TaxID=644358 RepID=A0A0C4E9S5_MAGP6|nr:hypothetical protein MAPG_09373 [Magnaporthiopsis poae ATCC 64411]